MQTPEITSKADKQIEILKEINEQLITISKDQKHIGEFLGDAIHKIRIWLASIGWVIIGIIIYVILYSLLE